MDDNTVYYKGLYCDCYPPNVFHNVLASFREFQALGLPLEHVLDIGAHHGSLSLLAAHFGAAHIVAVEPIHIGPLKKNISNTGFGAQIKVIEGAVCDSEDEEVDVHYFDDGGMQSVLYAESPDRKKMACRGPKRAKCIDFVMLAGQFDVIDYLKIDCEGAEFSFLSPTPAVRSVLTEKVRYIDLEIHPFSANMEDIYDSGSQLIHPEYRCDVAPQKMRGFVRSCGFDMTGDDERFGFGGNHVRAVNRGFTK